MKKLLTIDHTVNEINLTNGIFSNKSTSRQKTQKREGKLREAS
jgi:hypothetical protein